MFTIAQVSRCSFSFFWFNWYLFSLNAAVFFNLHCLYTTVYYNPGKYKNEDMHWFYWFYASLHYYHEDVSIIISILLFPGQPDSDDSTATEVQLLKNSNSTFTLTFKINILWLVCGLSVRTFVGMSFNLHHTDSVEVSLEIQAGYIDYVITTGDWQWGEGTVPESLKLSQFLKNFPNF